MCLCFLHQALLRSQQQATAACMQVPAYVLHMDTNSFAETDSHVIKLSAPSTLMQPETHNG